jgi:murein DD-endopeptidase MepM/ murein hydrolase activator NlpD
MTHVVTASRLGICAALALLAGAARIFVPAAAPVRTASEKLASSAPASVHAQVEPVAATSVLTDELGRGETLSVVWERNGRPASEMAGVVEAVSSAFDVRQLRAGTTVEIYLAANRASGLVDPATAGSVVEAPLGPESAPAPADSVVIGIDSDRRVVARAEGGERFRGELIETPVREVWRTHVGCIQGSLYAALETEGADFSPLALELDRIYGGEIDFYSDLQPGDCVTVYFQTWVRPDGSFRLGRIEAAEFVNAGRHLPAVWFEAPDKTGDYYDLEGKSLRRQFLRSPIKFTRISSGFSMRRFHPLLRRYRAHPGIDFAAPAGTPVQAAGNGVVAFAGWRRGYGKLVEIKHGKVYTTSYAHLSRIAKGVRAGARVSQGEVIGFVGSTGLATGPHLDYRFSKNGKFVNPLKENFTTGEPVAPQYMALFAERRDRLLEPLTEVYRTVLVDRGASPGTPLPAAIPLLGAALPVQPSVGDD